MRYLNNLLDLLFVGGLLAANAHRLDWDGGPLWALFFYVMLREIAVWCYQASRNREFPHFELVTSFADVVAILGLMVTGVMCPGLGLAVFGAFILAVLFFFRPLIKEELFGIQPSDARPR